MNFLPLATAFSLCLAIGLHAEDPADKPAPAGEKPAGKPEHKEGGFMREEILKKFDKDGDGKLNDEEKAAAKVEMEKKRGEMLKEFDKDGDGKLSDDERKAMREAMILKKFDKDGDGKLNDEEKAAAEAAHKEMEGKGKGKGKGEGKPEEKKAE
jgi:uncharacterized protein YqeY